MPRNPVDFNKYVTIKEVRMLENMSHPCEWQTYRDGKYLLDTFTILGGSSKKHLLEYIDILADFYKHRNMEIANLEYFKKQIKRVQ